MKTALEMRNGVPSLVIDGEPVAPMMVWGRSNSALSCTAELMQPREFHLYTTPLPLPWPQPGDDHDFGAVDAEMGALLANDPQALTMPRITVEPPAWWKEQHPEEMPVWENGKSDQFISVTSVRLLQEAPTHIHTLVTHLESRWNEHVFAYHPSALNSAEWYYASTIWQCGDWGLRNYEASFARGYQRWLEEQYETLDELNRAWKTAYRAFAQVQVPPPEQRRRTDHGLLRNPVAERPVIDFTVYQSVAITDAIRIMARTFKDACDWRKLVYIFYGYTFELAGLQEGISQFGHLDLDAVLDDPAIDVWCGPSGYVDRRTGGSGPIMAPAESCNARSRVWCNEDDLRTHLSKPDTGWGRVATEEETLWAHQRNFMASYVRRSQMWFMDQGGNWLESEAIWDNLAALKDLYRELLENPTPLRSDVAVVVDEPSLCQVAYGIELGLPLLYDLRTEINRMGTTPELWLQADYLRGKVKGKKLVIFLNAFSLTAQERGTVTDHLQRDGATALWFYAPGVLAPDADSPGDAYGARHISELTGIHVVERDGDRSPAMRCTRDHPFCANLPDRMLVEPDDIIANWGERDEKFQFRQMTYPPRKKLRPLFAVQDPDADVFGHYADTGEAAMAARETAGACHVFVGGLTLPAQVLANIAREASVHLYCEAGDVLYTDGHALSITACTAGRKSISLPASSTVSDALTGELITCGESFTVELRFGETRVFRLGSSAM
ncbi:MAG: hypothetical protein HON70_38355 [Lentisphaerae bacterium]|nr:hypothetical protein [Lentisphaerota bacterium]